MPLKETDVRILLRRLLEEGTFVVTHHARVETDKDGLSQGDIVNVIRGGAVGSGEWENGSWHYRVETQRIAVVVAIEPEPTSMPSADTDVSSLELVVVTAWRKRT
jgi:hypothetical protein